MSLVDAIVLGPLSVADRHDALDVINTAARWYGEFLPVEESRNPEMTADEWDEEGQRGTWYGAFVSDTLVAVMALEYVKDVALVRHGYVRPGWQRQGVGTALLRHLEGQVAGVRRIVVGTYAANYKAQQMLARADYRLSDDSEAVLRAYYEIPDDRLRASVTYQKLV